MVAAKNAVKVEGLRELQREVRKAKDKELRKKLRAANKEAAQEVVDQAKVDVPVRSGRLRKSIGNASTPKEGRVKAGTAKTVPYAGPIHFGWPSRPNAAKRWRGGPIRPQPFIYEALDRRINDVKQAYEKAMDKISRGVSTD